MAKELPTARPQACPEPSCAAPLDLPYLCGSCGSLLRPPPGMNHFERFGLAPSMDIEPQALEDKYLELSRQLHPDRMVGQKRATQSRALILSSALNDAYQTLKNERLRAELLLSVHGGKTAEQDKRTPQSLLLEMMDLHEQVDDAKAANNEEALASMRKDAVAKQGESVARARALFADPAFPSPELLDAIREELNVAKYWVTLEELAK